MAQIHSRSSSGSANYPSRRDFLRRAGLTAGGLLTLTAPNLFGKWVDHAVAADQRTYVAGKFALELDGQAAGFGYSVEGGAAVGEVAIIAMGANQIPNKQLTNLRYEPIAVEFGAGMSKAWYDWISSTLDMKIQPRNGAVLSLDFNNVEQSRLNFMNALITEITFPALDAASKDAARMTVKLAPAGTQQKSGSKAVVGGMSLKQKQWLPANFRLFIQGLEQATKRVNKLEALTIKFKTQSDQVGKFREAQKEPVVIEIPNLIFTIPEIDAGPFYQWHEDFVIKGNNGPDRERPGVLEWLTPAVVTGPTVLGSLQFFNLGIFKIAPEKLEAGADTIRRVKVEMYCERIAAAFPGFV
ncbi:MAG: twin-arginine translocation signal domain-containing protein [Nitrospirae bacterium]|nr:MAG: twin-arginine translocation signal domain-containing protein [Nitrospirota bacterium]